MPVALLLPLAHLSWAPWRMPLFQAPLLLLAYWPSADRLLCVMAMTLKGTFIMVAGNPKRGFMTILATSIERLI